MKLPEWDFGGDEGKRRDFIIWVNEELDHFATLTGTYEEAAEPEIGWTEYLKNARPAPHRRANPASGMNELVWEYALLRFMIDRYWPRKRRSTDDPAHPANIVIERSRGPLPSDHRKDAAKASRIELRDRLLEEWERRTPSKGMEQAKRDIAILRALPPALFAK